MTTTATDSPTAVTERDIRQTTVDDALTEYLDVGCGPVVVLVHGDGETTRDWSRVAPALAAAGHRMVASSLPGHARAPRRRRTRWRTWAGWLGRFLDTLGSSWSPSRAR